jgi:hypothetical protein
LNFDCLEELEKALITKTINYNEVFEESDGHNTCQDMASHFLRVLPKDTE